MMHLLAAKVKVCQLAGNQLLDLCYVDGQVTPRTTVPSAGSRAEKKLHTRLDCCHFLTTSGVH